MIDKPRVTLREIALEAGVSIATVSRVISGSVDVKPELKAKVFDAMQKLSYIPKTQKASSASSSGRIRIGVLVNDLADSSYPFLLRGILDVAKTLGVEVSILETMRSTETETACVRRFVAEGVNGLISIPFSSEINPEIQALVHSRFPVVFILNPNNRHTDFIASYVTSDSRGVLSATKYLLDLGHRDILYLGDPHIPRFRGFQRAMAEACITPNPALIVDCEDRFDAAYTYIKDHFRRGLCSAILGVSENIGLGCWFALAEMGYSIPGDCSLVCYDNSVIARHLSLTTIVEPLVEIGKNAAHTLYDVIHNPYAPVKSVVLNDSLMIRGSCRRA